MPSELVGMIPIMNKKHLSTTMEEHRVNMINKWIADNNSIKIESFAVIDDMPLEMENFVQTDYRYGIDKETALKTIKILNNKINCIFGKSGSGKTTIIKTLIKLIKPITGSITINNTNLEDIDTIYLRNNISFMTQEQILFNDTVFKNIIYGCNKKTKFLKK